MYTWALHRRLSNEPVHNPDSLPSKSLLKPAGKSRGGEIVVATALNDDDDDDGGEISIAQPNSPS